MERVNIKALLLGVATDIGSTLVASTVIFSIFASGTFSDQMTAEEMEAAMKQLTENGGFLLTSLIVGLACSALGGYVAARIAQKEIYLNAGLIGVASILLGLLFGTDGPFWFQAAGFTLVVPAALYGGYLADSQRAT